MITLIAHQGGWDEVVLVAGPLAAFALVLFLANRRANTKLAQRRASDGAQPESDSPADDGD